MKTNCIIALLFASSILPALAQTATVTGTVYIAGLPTPHVKIELFNDEKDVRPIGFAFTNSSGTYAIGNVPMDKLRVKVTPADGEAKWYRVKVDAPVVNVSPKIEGDGEKDADALRKSPSNPMKPVDELYKAWEDGNIDAYKKQWAPGATRAENGRPQSLNDLFGKRTEQFKTMGKPNVSYTVLSAKPDGAAYNIVVRYTFKFRIAGARNIENGGIDKFKVTKTADGWKIAENRDDAL